MGFALPMIDETQAIIAHERIYPDIPGCADDFKSIVSTVYRAKDGKTIGFKITSYQLTYTEDIMIEHRPLSSLGGTDHGWLNAKHHFSFAEYQDPERIHWGALRVWNDDTIQPGTGFPMHPHADMEIITYVREGAITHQDSLGNKGRTVAGDVQVMSAGTGIRHSEYNMEPGITRIFQIWVLPDGKGGATVLGYQTVPERQTFQPIRSAGQWY